MIFPSRSPETPRERLSSVRPQEWCQKPRPGFRPIPPPAVLVCHSARYLIDLAGHNLFGPLRTLQCFSQAAPFGQGHYPVGELFKDYVGSKKTSEFRTRGSTLDSLQI